MKLYWILSVALACLMMTSCVSSTGDKGSSLFSLVGHTIKAAEGQDASRQAGNVQGSNRELPSQKQSLEDIVESLKDSEGKEHKSPFEKAELDVGINKLMNSLLFAQYTYLSMFNYYDRRDVALLGFAKFFKELAAQRLAVATSLMKLQNLRGAPVVLQHITRPLQDVWGFGIDGMHFALNLEQTLRKAALDVDGVANDKNDIYVLDALEGGFLVDQLQTIKNIFEAITQLSKTGPGLGEFLYDKCLLTGTFPVQH